MNFNNPNRINIYCILVNTAILFETRDTINLEPSKAH